MSRPAPGGTVICRRCGTPNATDDQFCGGCGGFLEWAAEPTELASTTPTPAPVDAPMPAPIDAPTGTTPASSAPAHLVRCPTCGTANVAGRTFCQKCGGRLVAATTATRLPLTPRPLTGVATPTVAPTASTTAAPSTRRRRDPADEGGGIPAWLVVAGAGALVGAVAVVIVLLLGSGSPPPPRSASSAPSASASASESPVASPSADASGAVGRGTVGAK